MDKIKEKKELAKELNEEPEGIELLQTVKDTGVGLRMPDGNVLEVSDLDPALSQWMLWVTETLNDLKKNLI